MTILERLLQPVWEVSSEPIVVTGNEPDPKDRKILYVNQAFTRVNGYAKEEAIGRDDFAAANAAHIKSLELGAKLAVI